VVERVGGSNGRHCSPRGFGTGCRIVQGKGGDWRRESGCGRGRMIRRSRFEVRDQDVFAVRELFLLELTCSSCDACMLRFVGNGHEVLGSSCDTCESRRGRDGFVLSRSSCRTCKSRFGGDGFCGRVVI
jgi:hypothetical protein